MNIRSKAFTTEDTESTEKTQFRLLHPFESSVFSVVKGFET